MKVPDELVETAMSAVWPGLNEGVRRRVIRDEVEATLEAVLPKVRERLLSGETNKAVRARWFDAVMQFDGDDRLVAKALTEAAFDHAFPEEGS